MQEHGFFFDHNLHALRIVEDFEMRYAAFRGLNLTFEVREGIIKHSHDHPAEKFPELAEYLLDLRPPLEAQLIDVADEIAYSTADLDDGYESHLLTLEQIRNGVPVFERLYTEVESIYPDAIDKLKFNETVKRVLDRWAGDLIENTRKQIRQAGVRTLDDVRICPRRLVELSLPAEQERREAKEFLYKNLYFSATLNPEKNDAERVISELFQFWMAKPDSLPSSYQEKATQEPLPRVVCDYIAGMTDNYIYEQYEKYCGH
jgi:dGTPase